MRLWACFRREADNFYRLPNIAKNADAVLVAGKSGLFGYERPQLVWTLGRNQLASSQRFVILDEDCVFVLVQIDRLAFHAEKSKLAEQSKLPKLTRGQLTDFDIQAAFSRLFRREFVAGGNDFSLRVFDVVADAYNVADDAFDFFDNFLRGGHGLVSSHRDKAG